MDAEQRIAELENQIEELLRQVDELQSTIIDWHSAMFGALNLILKDHQSNLEWERERLLNLMPRRIDCMIVKKNASIPIDMDAFRIFRKYNVIELKSYQDSVDMGVIWTTISYATQFMAMENKSPDDLTITIIRSAYPKALFEQLKQFGWTVEEKYHNIYYLSGRESIPIQIMVAKDLGDEYLPLQILTGRAKEADVRKFMEYRRGLTSKSDIEFADAVVSASAEANREIFERLKKEADMNAVLKDIMREDLIAAKQDGAEEERNAMTERLIDLGSDGATISKVTGYDRTRIDRIAARMNRIVSWGDNRA